MAPAIPITATESYSQTPSIKPDDSISATMPTIIPSVPVSTESLLGENLDVNCVVIDQTLLSRPEIEESNLLLQEDKTRQVYLMNLKSMETSCINGQENEIIMDFSVSPDGERLALTRSKIDGITTKSSNLEILSSDSQVLKNIPIDVGLFISRWLDKERIVLTQGLGPSSPQIVLNIITGSQQDLQTDFPDLYDMPPTSNWENQGVVVYDPSLTRVVYAGAPADIVFDDVRNENIIFRLSPAPVIHSVPKWSPDGQQVVFTYADILNPINNPDHWRFEIYSLSWDGQFKQLTNLSETYQFPRMPYYKWSPDGKYIAFWLETAPGESPGVFDFSVLNLTTETVTNYCIKSVARGMPKFFWSPNSDYVILETFKANDDKSNQLILLDIKKSGIIQIGENLHPLGWMTSP